MSRPMQLGAWQRHRHLLAAGVLALIAALTLTLAADSADAKGKTKHKKPAAANVTVMTRNLYLGADLTPALAAATFKDLVHASGAILRQVDATDFETRAKALAAEILTRKPDLVGLQEVAMWRTQTPPDGPPGPPAYGTPAVNVNYDFLVSLMFQLNQTGSNYRVVKVNQEFDKELTGDYLPAPIGGNSEDPPYYGADTDGRLTMRDVILAKVDPAVKTWGGTQGHYRDLLTVNTVVGPIEVTRGFLSTNASVRGAKFHFVDTHFEAFDDATQNPSIRSLQAQQLVSPLGAAGAVKNGGKPVILVGDLNSNNPGYTPGDSQAYDAVRAGGFTNLDTGTDGTCCLSDPFLTGGSLADFDHKVDHIMTDRPGLIKQVKAFKFGFAKVDGLQPSDHAGVASKVSIKIIRKHKK